MQEQKSQFAHKRRGSVLAQGNRVIATGTSAHLDTSKMPVHAVSTHAEERVCCYG